MRVWFKLSIRHKLVSAISGSLLLTIVLSTILSNFFMRDEAIDRITERELPHILKSVASQVELEITIPYNAAKSMASNTLMLAWLEKGEATGEISDISRYLNSVKSHYQAESAFFISAESGNYYNHNGLNRTLSRSNNDDRWFYNLLEKSERASLELDVDASSGVYTLFINYLTDNQEAVTGLGLKVTQLADLIREYKIGKKGLVYLVDDKGNIRIHPNSRYIGGKSLGDIGFENQEVGELLSKRNGAIVHQEAQARVVSSRYIESLNWYLVAEIPTNEIYGGIDAASLKIVFFNLVLAVVLIGMSVLLAGKVARPIATTAQMLDSISKGDADLTKKLHVNSKDELGLLAEAFNRFTENMRQLITQLAETAEEVEKASSEMQSLDSSIQADIINQQQSINMVATATNEMGATVNEIAQNASSTANASSQSAQEATHSCHEVENTVKGIKTLNSDIEEASEVIQRLADDVGQISSILAVISGISEQTNLLALNAAIEAARAGEQGRGFAVVADEVRTLASRTHESTEEINNMIGKLQQGAADAVSAMAVGLNKGASAVEGADKTGKSLHTITEAIQSISDMSMLVATATEEQSSVVEDLNKHITSINDVATRTTQCAQENAEACERLHNSASKLTQMVQNFRY